MGEEEIRDIEVITRCAKVGTTDRFFVREFSLKDAVMVAQVLCMARGDVIMAIHALTPVECGVV